MKLIDETVLESFCGMAHCEVCGKYRELCGHHYWIRRGCGGGTRIDHPFNLIGLCHECHTTTHDAKITSVNRYRLLDIVACREGVMTSTIVEFLSWLSRQERSRMIGVQVRVV